MNKIFSKQFLKVTIDILLVIGFFVSVLFSRHSEYNASWGSFHCIASMIWYVLILVHIGQHWRMLKVLWKWKVIKRNIITTMTVIVFILMTISVILFIAKINVQSIHVHHIIAHLFWVMIIIHAITKVKRFVRLIKK